MKNFRLKAMHLYLVLACVILTSCSGFGELDGKTLKDSSGNYYRLRHKGGVLYAVDKINKNELDSLYAR